MVLALYRAFSLELRVENQTPDSHFTRPSQVREKNSTSQKHRTGLVFQGSTVSLSSETSLGPDFRESEERSLLFVTLCVFIIVVFLRHMSELLFIC